MSRAQQSFEEHRLEIILTAAAVLFLVSALGILILYGIGLRPPGRSHDAEHCWQSTAALGGMWPRQSPIGTVDSYNDEKLVDSMRRRSTILAEDFKRELSILKQQFSGSDSSGKPARVQEDSGDSLHKFEAKKTLTRGPRTNQHDICDDSDSDDSESSLVAATGREEDADRSTRQRSGCMTERVTACDTGEGASTYANGT